MTIEESIVRVVEEGIAARSAFYKLMNEPDNQSLGASKAGDNIEKIELFIRKKLSPSYTSFLRCFNGWKMFDAATDLLSAESVCRWTSDPKLTRWRKIAMEVENLEVQGWLLIGNSEVMSQKYFLVTSEVDEFGEMPVVDHDKVFQERYPDFLTFLRQTNRQYEEGLSDIDGDMDFSGI